MHGLIFSEFKKFIEQKYGEDTWKTILKESGFENKIYLAVSSYPDSEFFKILEDSSKILNKDRNLILEEFGRFIVKDLAKVFKSLVKPEWDILSFLENFDKHIHRMIRIKYPGAKPPAIFCERKSENEVILHYRSPRKLCKFVKGIIKESAKFFKSTVVVHEIKCSLYGAEECIFIVRKIK